MSLVGFHFNLPNEPKESPLVHRAQQHMRRDGERERERKKKFDIRSRADMDSASQWCAGANAISYSCTTGCSSPLWMKWANSDRLQAKEQSEMNALTLSSDVSPIYPNMTAVE